MAFQNTSVHYTLDQLDDGVYVATAKDGGAAVCNAGLVNLGDSTLVIDTFMTPTAAEELRADAQRLTGRIPNKVINTHYHNDHIWGNQVFLPDADIFSTAETRLLIQTAGKEEYDYYRAVTDDRLKNLLAQQAMLKSKPDARSDRQATTFELMIGFFNGLALDFPRLSVILPNIVFKNHMILYGSRRRVELVEFSGAHTESDTVVYLPDDGIIFMSDLLFIGHHGYLGDGNPDRWQEVLRSILDGTAGIQTVDRFVPGHGMTGTQADMQRFTDYIHDCQQIAQSLAAESKISQVEASSINIPQAYANWSMPIFFHANLRFLFEQYKSIAEGSGLNKSKPASNSFRP